MPRHKIAFITIVPSPYQRDLFLALAARPEIQLSVYYLEAESPDSPWPKAILQPFENLLPGTWMRLGPIRAHLNWPIPDLADQDLIVLSSFSSFTGQYLMRSRLKRKRWVFWGERLRAHSGLKGRVQSALVAPLRKSRAIIGIGRAAQSDYALRFRDIPTFCIPYYCDLSKFLSRPLSAIAENDQVRFLFCGQMIPRKGVDILLSAFNRIISEGMRAKLILVGREDDIEAHLQSVSPGARASIVLEGFKAPDLLSSYFATCHVFVLPSRHDGWGVVVNQALGAGLPVITSDAVGAGLDYVENGINGMLVPAGDTDRLYAAMKAFILNPHLISTFGANSRVMARNLMPDVGAQKWLDVIERLNGGGQEMVGSPQAT